MTKRYLITGAGSGLGKAIYDAIRAPASVIGLETSDINLCEPEDYKKLPKLLSNTPVDYVINCAGVNYINWLEETPHLKWEQLIDTNARAIFLMTKELINRKLLTSPAAIVNIVSNASHIPMTNSIAYNASKAAAHIMTLQMARELRPRHNITVFGVSPNKMHSTGMTDYIDKRVCELRGWTPEEARKYQLASLPAGVETDPAAVAEFITFLLSSRERHMYLNGCIIPYGA